MVNQTQPNRTRLILVEHRSGIIWADSADGKWQMPIDDPKKFAVLVDGDIGADFGAYDWGVQDPSVQGYLAYLVPDDFPKRYNPESGAIYDQGKDDDDEKPSVFDLLESDACTQLGFLQSEKVCGGDQ